VAVATDMAGRPPRRSGMKTVGETTVSDRFADRDPKDMPLPPAVRKALIVATCCIGQIGSADIRSRVCAIYVPTRGPLGRPIAFGNGG